MVIPLPALGYSTNLHAAESLDELVRVVLPFAGELRRELNWDRLGLDLRLGQAAITDLRDGARLTDLARRCADDGLAVHTLNGFPLRAFQAARVKEQAYLPDWRSAERVDATLDLLAIALALSDEPLVTISTVPGTYKPFGIDGAAIAAIAANLGRWAAAADRAFHETGRTAVLCLEPEPWCLLENSHEVAWFWQGPLATAGAAAATTAGADGAAAIRRHLGVCVDTCHLSLAFEDQAAAVARMAAAGARIAKCQVSAAPEVLLPDPAGVAALAALHEPRFQHQTAAMSAAGSVSRVVDLDGLDRALRRLPGATRVRSHFHIPLDRPPTAHGLSSTVADSVAGLRACLAQGCTHVAVETYTWSLLAADARDVRRGTARELAWLATRVAEARTTDTP